MKNRGTGAITMINDQKEKKDVSYRSKLTRFFILAILIAVLVGLYAYLSSRVLMNDMTGLIERTQTLTELYNELGTLQLHTEDYISSRSTESLEYFYDSNNNLVTLMNQVGADANYTSRGIKIKNLNGMLENYLNVLDETIMYKRNKQIDDYVMGYQEALRQYDNICSYIETILSSDLTESAMQYTTIKEKIDKSTFITVILFVISISLIFVMIILFSDEITKPLRRLASYAQEVTKGNLDVEINDDRTSSEVRILFKTFGMMTDSIKKSINDLKEKQRLERSLDQEKLYNLEIESALHETELLALQSQVNPHFIFNSINIGSKIAMLEGDDVTCEYLENFADLFRYNLKGLGYNANLKEEINNVRAYMNLMLARFGDTFEFNLEIPEDEDILNFTLPRMTLQPLVENAFIHGSATDDENGVIEIKVKKARKRFEDSEEEENYIIISVANTGSEIAPETIEKILTQTYKKPKDKSKQGHTTGIGIDNVLSRLKLFYKREQVMDIKCSKGWTRFILTLPFDKNQGGDQETYEDNNSR